MKTLSLLFLFLLSFIPVNNIYSQDTYNYLPLKIGNSWIYSGMSATIQCHNSSWREKYKVTDTAQINGKTYFIISHQRFYIEGNCGETIMLFRNNRPLRIDPLSMNVYINDNCGTANEYLVDSLKSGLNDTAWGCDYISIICNDTTSYYFCSDSISSKLFHHGPWESGYRHRYARNKGLVTFHRWYPGGGGSIQISLSGCVIDGVPCGDTSFIIGIQQISSEIPVVYSLQQNFPNPFNPVTKIRFDIAKQSQAKIVVYDVMGKEIAVLFDEFLKPGTYSINFDGNNLASGTYFYNLSGDGFNITKKMIMVK